MTSQMTSQQTSRIDAVLGRRVSVEDQLAEISRDLADLHGRLARVLGTDVGFWTPTLPIEVSRATFEALDCPIVNQWDAHGQHRNTKRPQPGITVYCDGWFADHDLTAENAPGESANSTDYRHYFWRIDSALAGSWTRIIDR